MKIAIVSWLKGKSIPVKGYGGIERMVAVMAKELSRSNQVHLISPAPSYLDECENWHTTDFKEAEKYLDRIKPDIVWDNSCWSHDSVARFTKWPCVSTTHVNHAVGWSKNVIYLSQSQKSSHEEQLGRRLDNPIIYVPADPALKPRGLKREEYLLFLGSVTPWKGVVEAAELAKLLNRELWVAGPAWGEYAEKVAAFPNVNMIGEVDGQHKSDLLERAHAVTCLHNDGGIDWKEPGCGVVMEAGSFHTPVFASMNGCLPELVVNGVNGWKGDTINHLLRAYEEFEIDYPGVRSFTNYHFGVTGIANQYMEVFNKVLEGHTYGN